MSCINLPSPSRTDAQPKLGPDHPDTLAAENNLAVSLLQAGEDVGGERADAGGGARGRRKAARRQSAPPHAIRHGRCAADRGNRGRAPGRRRGGGLRRVLRLLLPLLQEGLTLTDRHPRRTHLDRHSAAIYYLLLSPDFSALHALTVTETYHFYAGSPLRMLLLHPDGTVTEPVLGPDVDAGQRPQLRQVVGFIGAVEHRRQHERRKHDEDCDDRGLGRCIRPIEPPILVDHE